MATFNKSEGLMDWLDKRLGVNKFLKVMMTEYWIPKNINFLWAMGVLLLTLFTLLVVSGLFLLMYYKPDTDYAFNSVNFTIMKEVEFGWLWRHIHAVAASMVFVIIYIHMFVAIYYGSYKQGREMVWIGGMLLFVVFSAEAFSGYMLPWGQMSYWAATVITNLFGGIPIIGDDLVEWIRGNYVVADATLTRFFMLHVVLLPVVIMLLIAFHFYSLRFPHVNNQDGEEINFEEEAKKYQEGKKAESKVIPFWPVFMSKDIFVVCAFMVLFFYLVCYHFDFAMDPVNFDPADSLKTPTHIYPEWYFLWSYEVLRGFFFNVGPIKASDIGLAAFGVAQVVFLLLPWLDRSPVVKPAHKRKAYFVWFWLLIVDLIVLTIYGKLPPEGINTYIGCVASLGFLFLIFVALPYITIKERKATQGGGL
ncbi:cytochrome b [Helicobacter sp. T3_23-1059]